LLAAPRHDLERVWPKSGEAVFRSHFGVGESTGIDGWRLEIKAKWQGAKSEIDSVQAPVFRVSDRSISAQFGTRIYLMTMHTKRDFHGITSALLRVTACFWLGLMPLCLAADKSQSFEGSAGDDLFAEVKVVKLQIRVEKPAMQALEEAPYSFVPAQVEEGGKAYPNVGLHLKGARTFQPLDKKPSLTVKFNEYMPRQTFHGLRKVLLNNALEEKTFIQERLGQDLFRAMGTPAPRVNYARVELNGRDLGLYVLVEGIAKDFLERNFGDSKGNLYEGVEADVDGDLEQDFGKRSRFEDLRPFIGAIRERDRSRRFQAMERFLNVDQFISYVALETMINAWDGYSLRCNNYRIYCDHANGRTTFIPHGLDNFFVEADAPLFPKMKGIASAALLDTPEGHRRYVQRLNEIYSTLLTKEALRRRIAELAAKTKPALKELNLAESQERALATFQQRIDRRLDYIGEELERVRSTGGPKEKAGP
jgi:spore coat protein H